MLLEENKPLAPHTTFGIGGPARWFVEAAHEDDVVEATGWARKRGLPLLVMGGGSNLLVADRGFDGLVVRVRLRGISCGSTSDSPAPLQRLYRVGAGEEWDSFVQRTVEENCAGFECLAGIPGLVGGTPVQNVGAYGQEVASTIERVRVFDLAQREFCELPGAECGFGYRSSRFNSADRGRYLVTRVDYLLTPGGTPTLSYADLQTAFQYDLSSGRTPDLAEVAQAVRRIRRAKGMLLVKGDPDCRSAGSFFKNPVINEALFHRIAQTSAETPPRFPAGEGLVKLPAAWLIEQAGFAKGYALGAAGISSRHTLALVNRGTAKAEDILSLAEKIAGAVEMRFGIRLEMEPVLAGF